MDKIIRFKWILNKIKMLKIKISSILRTLSQQLEVRLKIHYRKPDLDLENEITIIKQLLKAKTIYFTWPGPTKQNKGLKIVL